MKIILSVIAVTLVSLLAAPGNAQQQPTQTKAVELTGLVGVKHNTQGSLTVENGNLRFIYSSGTSDLAPRTMQDVVTGNDSQRVIRGTVGTLSMFAPYESGRFLSLFRSKIDTLTIEYSDAEGGLHGVIFTTPAGTADAIKQQLVVLGARTSIPAQRDPAPNPAVLTPDPAAKKTASDQSQAPTAAKINASAITVMMIESEEIKLPAEFQISLYENLIEQLQKKGGFQHVYREGDRASAGAANLVVLYSTVRGFKQGSERARQVTTVAGATSIRVHCEFTDPSGRLLLARDINGKVRFFGGNLKATYDFAKKAVNVAHQSVSPVAAD
jgi:hypothetical protein